MKRFLLLLLAVLSFSANLAAARANADQPCAQSSGNAAQNHPGDLNAAASDLAGGVVVEEIRKNSEGEKAGLREGDLLLRWVRDDACGDVASSFDLDQIEIEQEPRGAVTLEGFSGKDHQKQSWVIGADAWKITVRPQLAEPLFAVYREARELEKADKVTEAAERWRAAAMQARTDSRPWLSSWFLLQAAESSGAKQQWKEADAAYAEAIQPAEQSGPEIKAQLLRAWAKTYEQRSEWASAEKYYQQSIAESRKLGDESLIIAATLNDLGGVARYRGDLAQAQKYYQQALEITQKLAPGSIAAAASFSALGSIAFNRGNLTQAEEYVRQALQITQKLAPGSLAVAASLNNLGNLAAQRGDLAQAESYFEQALDIRRKLSPGSLAVAAALHNLGILAMTRGDFVAAEAHFREALDIDQKLAPGSIAVATTLNSLGNIADDRGDLVKAEEYHQQALDIKLKLAPGSLDVAMSINNLGNIAQERGDLAKAEECYEQALDIRRKLAPGSLDVAMSLNNLGGMAYKRGDLAKAEKYYQQDLEITQKVAPGSLIVAGGFNNLGLIAKDRGDLIKAAEWLHQALDIYQKLAPENLDAAEPLQALGDVAGEQNDLARAEEYYQQALAIREKLTPGSSMHAESLAALASIQSRKQQLDAAALLYEKALVALESQAHRLGGSEETRAGFRANHEKYYREYVDLLLAQKRPEVAFAVLERSRARSLLELLATGRVDIQQGVDAELLAREKSLQAEIAAKSGLRIRLLSEKSADTQIAAVTSEVLKLEEQYNDVEGQIRSTSPVYAALTQPKPLGAEEVQAQLLDTDTLLLEYSLGEEHSYVFAVTQDSVVASELPKRAEIEKVARRLYDALTARNRVVKEGTQEQAEARWARADAASRRASAELSQMILGPVAELLGKKRLLIVGDGVLHYIPFSALSIPEVARAAEATPARGGIPSKSSTLVAHRAAHMPLALEHEIVNLPSASVLAELRRQQTGRKEPGKTVAVLADPVFDATDERVAHGSQKTFTLPGALTRSMNDVGVNSTKRSSLHRLLYTRQEANAILSFTPAGQGMKALDFQASRATAMSESLAQYRIVHFATHGLLDSKHPEFSGLVLSMVNREGKAQDGFLGLADIYNLKLPVDLVVLSGCETALGQEISGEGLIGLTRGFMYAGASRVVASLWSVDDAATSKLMTHFYKAMERGGMRPAAALQAAQMEMWKQKAWNAPYYWASFQIQGEWR